MAPSVTIPSADGPGATMCEDPSTSDPVPPPLPTMTPAGDPIVPRDPRELTRTTPCVGCGYDLRGLASDGNCPECGAAVDQSLHGDFLRFAPPAYVRRLARGVTWMLWGLLVFVVVRGSSEVLARLPGMPYWIMVAGAITAPLPLLWGLWRVTTPDPRRRDAEPTLSARRIVRIVVLVILVHLALLGPVVFALPRLAGTGRVIGIIYYPLTFVASVLELAGVIACFVHLRALAMRVPAPLLSRRTRIVAWGTALGYVLHVVACGLMAAWGLVLLSHPGPWGAVPPAMWLIIGMTLVSGFRSLTLLVFGIWWAVLLTAYRRRFRDAADAADGNWTAGVSVIDDRVRLPHATGRSRW
ncbi:MAG: hypothetical protein ACOC95_04770 [Planctomycetota bacterium]